MNVFLLDEDHEARARAHCDSHVSKMTLESVQILNTALHKFGLGEHAFYQKTHETHPWVEWTARSRGNFCWMVEHARALGEEFHYRNGGIHASHEKLLDELIERKYMRDVISPDIKSNIPVKSDSVTPIPICTGDWESAPISSLGSIPDVIEIYRDYYAEVKYPQEWFSYSVEPPDWLLDRV